MLADIKRRYSDVLMTSKVTCRTDPTLVQSTTYEASELSIQFPRILPRFFTCGKEGGVDSFAPLPGLAKRGE